MTIGEENKVKAAIGHPRIMGGQFINLNIINQSRSVENDINFIEYPRDPTGDEFFKGPETLGVDMLKIQNEFEPTVRIKTQSEGAMSAVPDYMVSDTNPDVASVSREDGNEEVIQFDAYNDLVHFGGTKIRQDSEVVQTSDGTTLEKGNDYALDPNRGMIQLLPEGTNHNGLDAEYTISYDFKNTPRNIAYMISKIPLMGGTSVYVYDVDDFTGSDAGRTYNVFLETVRHEMDPNAPQEAELTLEMRDAVLIDFDDI